MFGTGKCYGDYGQCEKELSDEKGYIGFFGSEGFEFVLNLLEVEHVIPWYDYKFMKLYKVVRKYDNFSIRFIVISCYGFEQ